MRSVKHLVAIVAIVAVVAVALTGMVSISGPAVAQPTGVVDLPAAARTPGGPEAFAFNNEAVARTRADTWHLAGNRGAGVTVGMINFQFWSDGWDTAYRRHELPRRSTVATFCRAGDRVCGAFDSTFIGFRGVQDGVAYAELIHDMAPLADFAVATAVTTSNLTEAIDFFEAEGVDVIVRSSLSEYDGPGDGTGPIDDALADAVDAGMVVVQPVGNAAGGGYYRWNYANADGDEWVDFNDEGDERLKLTTCGQFRGMRWNDFGDSTSDISDYDLLFFRPNGDYAGLATSGDQDAGDPPIEFNSAICDLRSLPLEVGVRIRQAGASVEDDQFEVLGGNGLAFEYSTNEGSAGGPGEDSTSPGVLTVGALSSPTSGVVAPTSSRGPTRDGRTNPALVAASCLSTFSRSSCLRGTVASAAVVGGAVALYRAEHPDATPAQVRDWVVSEATVDRGVAGPDNASGAGELVLPSMGIRPRYRPDVRIQPRGQGPVIGNDRYTATGARQNGTVIAGRGREARFTVTFQNDGNTRERFLIGGSSSAQGFQVDYLVNNVGQLDVTQGRHSTPVVPPNGRYTMVVRVRVPPRPAVAGVQGLVQAVSLTTLRQIDGVRFTVLVS